MQSDSKQRVSQVSVIVPVLNEAHNLDDFCTAIKACDATEVLIVDGGSRDNTADLLRHEFTQQSHIQVLESSPGRAHQMQYGASKARCDWLLFLHADTKLPLNFRVALVDAEQAECEWGRFDLCFTATQTRLDRAMPVIAFFINLRSRLTRIATGDQALFVRSDLFKRTGGYKMLALMEDIEICKRLRKIADCHASYLRVTTSARRWQEHGVVRTVLLMWMLRLAYFVGVSPTTLARHYRNVR